MLQLIEIAKKYTSVEVYTVINGTHNENWMQDFDQYFQTVKDFIDK